MDKEIIHLIYGTDNNYIFPTMVSAASAVYGSVSAQIHLHLFDLEVEDVNYHQFESEVKRISPDCLITRHKLSKELFKGFGAWRGSFITYSRMLMAEILPTVEWAIYVDGDTLWLGDIRQLWDLRDDTKLLFASIDPPTPTGVENPEFAWYRQHGLNIETKNYLCMGLMLANLKKMREEHIAEKCQLFMQSYPNPRVVDQTVLNYICQGQTVALPKQWGVFSTWHYGVDLMHGACVHYVTDVPWNRRKINRLFSDIVLLWFDFCAIVLHRPELKKFSLWTRFWKRGVFLLLKYNQWILCMHPYLKSHLRNTHGLKDNERLQLTAYWRK